MIISQYLYEDENWTCFKKAKHGKGNKIIFVFADRFLLEKNEPIRYLKEKFPSADIVSSSTSGDFLGTTLSSDNTLCATVVEFSKSHYKAKAFKSSDYKKCDLLGIDITNYFSEKGLKHILLFSEGTTVNGSFLTEGINQLFRDKISVTGGLAGDGNRFKKTIVGLNEDFSQDYVVAVGLYGQDLEIGFGHSCAFESFGLLRKVTKSIDNVLHEIDGKPALSLYKEYLGEHAQFLPESALWFPLEISKTKTSSPFVRTILGIDEDKNTMTFAGNVPEGSFIRLMRSNIQDILASAEDSANASKIGNPESEGLALLISCVGRRSILKDRTEEELEEVRDILPANMILSGYYSYGELSSKKETKGCDLYNQTMTITTLRED